MTTRDLERVASEIADEELGWIFETFVLGTEALSADLVYAPIGLRVEHDRQMGLVLKVDAGASPEARALRSQILGID